MLDLEIQTRLTVPPSAEFPAAMSPGRKWPPRASTGQDPHLPTPPKATKSPFLEACGERLRERVNLLTAKFSSVTQRGISRSLQGGCSAHPPSPAPLGGLKYAFSFYFFSTSLKKKCILNMNSSVKRPLLILIALPP